MILSRIASFQERYSSSNDGNSSLKNADMCCHSADGLAAPDPFTGLFPKYRNLFKHESRNVTFSELLETRNNWQSKSIVSFRVSEIETKKTVLHQI